MGTGGSVENPDGEGGGGTTSNSNPTQQQTAPPQQPRSATKGDRNSDNKEKDSKAAKEQRRKDLGLDSDDDSEPTMNSGAQRTSGSGVLSPGPEGVLTSPPDASPSKGKKKTKVVKKIVRKVVSKNGVPTTTSTVITTTSKVNEDGTVILTKETTGGAESGGRFEPSTNSGHVESKDVPLFQGSEVKGWTKGPQIGKGATGAVYRATEHSTDSCFCVKEIEFGENFVNNPQDLQRFHLLRAEIALLQEVKHPNVVRFIGVDKIGFSMFIMMELVAGGNLAEIIKQFGALSDAKACLFTKQIVEGLVYLHDKNIIHRDIKGANILVGVDGAVKLADFGAAKRIMDPEVLFKTLAGTPYWMAPEVVRQEGHGKPADIWSLGATVLQMITGLAPFQTQPPVRALFNIGNKDRGQHPIPQDIKAGPLVLDFISRCFHRDANERPTVRDLLDHPWIQSAGNAPSGPPKAGPSDRSNTRDAAKEEDQQRVAQTEDARARREALETDTSFEEDEIREFIIHKCFAQALEEDDAYYAPPEAVDEGQVSAAEAATTGERVPQVLQALAEEDQAIELDEEGMAINDADIAEMMDQLAEDDE